MSTKMFHLAYFMLRDYRPQTGGKILPKAALSGRSKASVNVLSAILSGRFIGSI